MSIKLNCYEIKQQIINTEKVLELLGDKNAELEEIQDAHNELLSKLNDYKSNIKQLENENSIIKLKHDEHRQMHCEILEKYKKMELRCRSLEDQIESTFEDRNIVVAEIDSLKQKAKSAEKSNNILFNENQSLNELVETFKENERCSAIMKKEYENKLQAQYSKLLAESKFISKLVAKTEEGIVAESFDKQILCDINNLKVFRGFNEDECNAERDWNLNYLSAIGMVPDDELLRILERFKHVPELIKEFSLAKRPKSKPKTCDANTQTNNKSSYSRKTQSTQTKLNHISQSPPPQQHKITVQTHTSPKLVTRITQTSNTIQTNPNLVTRTTQTDANSQQPKTKISIAKAVNILKRSNAHYTITNGKLMSYNRNTKTKSTKIVENLLNIIDNTNRRRVPLPKQTELFNKRREMLMMRMRVSDTESSSSENPVRFRLPIVREVPQLESNDSGYMQSDCEEKRGRLEKENVLKLLKEMQDHPGVLEPIQPLPTNDLQHSNVLKTSQLSVPVEFIDILDRMEEETERGKLSSPHANDQQTKEPDNRITDQVKSSGKDPAENKLNNATNLFGSDIEDSDHEDNVPLVRLKGKSIDNSKCEVRNKSSGTDAAENKLNNATNLFGSEIEDNSKCEVRNVAEVKKSDCLIQLLTLKQKLESKLNVAENKVNNTFRPIDNGSDYIRSMQLTVKRKIESNANCEVRNVAEGKFNNIGSDAIKDDISLLTRTVESELVDNTKCEVRNVEDNRNTTTDLFGSDSDAEDDIPLIKLTPNRKSESKKSKLSIVNPKEMKIKLTDANSITNLEKLPGNNIKILEDINVTNLTKGAKLSSTNLVTPNEKVDNTMNATSCEPNFITSSAANNKFDLPVKLINQTNSELEVMDDSVDNTTHSTVSTTNTTHSATSVASSPPNAISVAKIVKINDTDSNITKKLTSPIDKLNHVSPNKLVTLKGTDIGVGNLIKINNISILNTKPPTNLKQIKRPYVVANMVIGNGGNNAKIIKFNESSVAKPDLRCKAITVANISNLNEPANLRISELAAKALKRQINFGSEIAPNINCANDPSINQECIQSPKVTIPPNITNLISHQECKWDLRTLTQLPNVNAKTAVSHNTISPNTTNLIATEENIKKSLQPTKDSSTPMQPPPSNCNAANITSKKININKIPTNITNLTEANITSDSTNTNLIADNSCTSTAAEVTKPSIDCQINDKPKKTSIWDPRSLSQPSARDDVYEGQYLVKARLNKPHMTRFQKRKEKLYDASYLDYDAASSAASQTKVIESLMKRNLLDKKGVLRPAGFNKLLRCLLHYNGEHCDTRKIVKLMKKSVNLHKLIVRCIIIDCTELETIQISIEPRLTKLPKIILGLLDHFDREIPDFTETLLTYCEKMILHRLRKPEHVERVTRFYAAICKMRGEIFRIRRTIYDGLYFMGDAAMVLLYHSILSWIEIFYINSDKHSPEELFKDNPLNKVLIQVVLTKKCFTPEYGLETIKKTMQQVYFYPTERYDGNKLMQEFLERYMHTKRECYAYAALILCQNSPAVWCYKQAELIKELIYIIKDANMIKMLFALIVKIQISYNDDLTITKFKELLQGICKDLPQHNLTIELNTDIVR